MELVYFLSWLIMSVWLGVAIYADYTDKPWAKQCEKALYAAVFAMVMLDMVFEDAWIYLYALVGGLCVMRIGESLLHFYKGTGKTIQIVVSGFGAIMGCLFMLASILIYIFQH